jgi:hypothetical protein
MAVRAAHLVPAGACALALGSAARPVHAQATVPASAPRVGWVVRELPALSDAECGAAVRSAPCSIRRASLEICWMRSRTPYP